MMRVRRIIPILMVAVLTIVAILPWGMPSANRFVLPLLPIVAIYYWTLDRDAWLPEWALFLVGLLLDVLMQGPLGYWALVYLVAYVAAVLCSRFQAETTIQAFVLFAGAMVAVTVFAWLTASVYIFELIGWEPYVRGAGIAVLAAGILTLATGALRSSTVSRVRPIRLTRGE